MNFDLEHIKDLTGTLITLDDSSMIPDVFIQMNSSSSRKLAGVLRSGRLTGDNQELIFSSISIPKNSIDILVKGQSCLVKDGNRLIMTAAPSNPARFKGLLQTLVRGSDGCDYVCNVELGNMHFDIGDKAPLISDDIAIFENITVVLYPNGNYRAFIPKDENKSG